MNLNKNEVIYKDEISNINKEFFGYLKDIIVNKIKEELYVQQQMVEKFYVLARMGITDIDLMKYIRRYTFEKYQICLNTLLTNLNNWE